MSDSGHPAGTVVASRPVDGLDYEKLAEVMRGASDDAEAKEKLAYGAIILALTTFVFISMLNYIPVLATDLSGGVFEVPNLYEKVGQNFIGANQVEAMAAQASHTVRKGAAGRKIQEFEKMITSRLP